MHPTVLTWNELFLVNVTILRTLPKRWKIWCKISKDTGYSSDSTITLSTVFRPQLSWAAPCGAAGSETPDNGSGEPLAGELFWKSGF